MTGMAMVAEPVRTTSRLQMAWRVVWVLLRVGLVVAAVFMAGSIAWNSRPTVHPDEMMHVDAFRYFETAWGRPAPGSDLVRYSNYGWSRVFTGEVVYEVYGKIGRVVKAVYSPAQGWADVFALQAYRQGEAQAVYRLYRLINVGLLAVTLAWLMFARCRWFPPWVLAVTVLAIPQCVYIYGYANSDGWGLSACLLLFVASAQLAERRPDQWTWRRVMVWAGLVVCLLLSKTGFVIGIVLPLVVIGVSLLLQRPGWKWAAVRVLLPLVAAYCIAAAYQPYIRPFAGKYRAAVRAAKEIKADPEYRGEVPQHWGSNLFGKGYDLQRMLNHVPWMRSNFTSFYSRFGGWDVYHPQWTFEWAMMLLWAGIGASMVGRLIWSRGWCDWLCTAVGPLVGGVSFLATLWHSLHIDYQPQGRYLFACVVPLAFWWCGGMGQARWWWRALQWIVVAGAIGLSFYILWEFGVNSDVLNS